MISEDVVGAVARGIYSAVLASCSSPAGTAPFFDELPADAKGFLRKQARTGLERLRSNVTDAMCAAGAELEADPHEMFVAMLDAALAKDMN